MNKAKAEKRWQPSMKNNARISEVISPNINNIPTKQSIRCSKQECDFIYEPEKTKTVFESPNYVIIDINKLSELFENLICSTCKTSSLRLVLGEQYGFSCQMKLVCDACDLQKKKYLHLRKLVNLLELCVSHLM